MIDKIKIIDRFQNHNYIHERVSTIVTKIKLKREVLKAFKGERNDSPYTASEYLSGVNYDRVTVQTSDISNSTAEIAEEFAEQVLKIQKDILCLHQEAEDLIAEWSETERWLDILKPKQKEIIRLILIEDMQPWQITKTVGYSERGIRKIKHAAIEKIYNHINS